MRKYKLLLVVIVIFISIIACESSSDETDQMVRTLVVESDDSPVEPDDQPAVTATTAPTETPEIEGLIKEGTHLVGSDIEPGIYVGLAGEGLFDSCYWARLSNLTGEDDILANDNSEGLYYIEVLPDDVALETACELVPIDKIPARVEMLTEVPIGTYIVGRDIGTGIYVGFAGEDFMDSCYWSRLSNLSGEDDILANDNAMGLYYLEVLPDDVALKTGCELASIDSVPPRDEFLIDVPAGTYIIGRDIGAGLYRGEAGTDFSDSCYWARLKNVTGNNDILANDNATGQYFIQVLPTDYALKTRCPVSLVEE